MRAAFQTLWPDARRTTQDRANTAGKLRYPSLFRGHGIRLLSTWRLSLRRLYPRGVSFPPLGPPGGSVPVSGVREDTTTSPSPYPTTYGFVVRLQPRLSHSLGQVRERFLPPGSLRGRSGALGPIHGWEYGDLPGSWDAPSVPLPCSLTPAGPGHPTAPGASVLPPYPIRRRLQQRTISGLYHTALAPAVYASRRISLSALPDSLAVGGEPFPRGSGTLQPAIDSTRWLRAFPAREWNPLGIVKGFRSRCARGLSPFSSLSCRTLGLFRTIRSEFRLQAALRRLGVPARLLQTRKDAGPSRAHYSL